jgi:hypothetical protein
MVAVPHSTVSVQGAQGQDKARSPNAKDKQLGRKDARRLG